MEYSDQVAAFLLDLHCLPEGQQIENRDLL